VVPVEDRYVRPANLKKRELKGLAQPDRLVGFESYPESQEERIESFREICLRQCSVSRNLKKRELKVKEWAGEKWRVLFEESQEERIESVGYPEGPLRALANLKKRELKVAQRTAHQRLSVLRNLKKRELKAGIPSRTDTL